MTKISEISSNSIQKTNKKTKKNKGALPAMGAAQVANISTVPIGMATVAGISQINKKLSPEQIKTLNEAADKVIETTGLKLKGVKIDDVKYAGINLTGIPDSIYNVIDQYSAVANGKNACFLTKDVKNMFTGKVLHSKNTIIANREKLPTALFHEIGHAFNANKSKFWSAMQKVRTPAMFIASSMALFVAFTKNAEAKDGKELTKAQKAKNFVRNNAGYIAGASMLPVVAEEIMASARGCKWANANLPKELAKKVKSTNLVGAMSYISLALGSVLATVIAKNVKDSIVEKQNAKLASEQG